MDLLPASEQVAIFEEVGLTVFSAALKMHRLLESYCGILVTVGVRRLTAVG
jgi:hypothetical protein